MFIPLCFSLMCALLASAQETDLNELANTLSQQDIPVRVPPFMFNKDRTPSNITRRIIGGYEATAHEYPFQVALFIYVSITQYFCGGSLITPEWVLTAAHCVEFADSILVILGSHNISQAESSRVVYNSTTFFIHKNWDSATIQYDVALIQLPEQVTLNDYINTVPIAYGTDTYAGLMSRCLGWGKTLFGALSNVLRYVDSEVITNVNCSSYKDYGQYIVDHHLCTTGEGIVGSCNGDSGGPLIINGTQVGIVSFGATDCAAGLPSVYTRLTYFYTWVNNTIEKSSGIVHKIGLLSNIYVGIIFGIVIANWL